MSQLLDKLPGFLAILIQHLVRPLLLFIVLSQATWANASPGISLDLALKRVVTQNFQISAQQLQMEAAQASAEAEKGAFEPRFTATYTFEDNNRLNNRQQQLNQASTSFDEENQRMGFGVEALIPTGAQLRLSSNISRLQSNLYRPPLAYDHEYETFTGLSLRQPLLKGAGYTMTMARIRLAGSRSSRVMQQTRQQLATVLSQAEMAYWSLYRANLELDLRRDSVLRARKLLEDNRARLQGGKMSQIDVAQAEAALGLREAQSEEAMQTRRDALANFATLLGYTSEESEKPVELSDTLVLTEVDSDYETSLKSALNSHPIILERKEELVENDLRLDVAKNQRRPQLDLIASYGVNGLGTDFNDSVDGASGGDYVSWAAGFELQIPMLGGTRERNELLAARKQRESASMLLRASQDELRHRLRSSLANLNNMAKQVKRYEEVVRLNQTVLDAELSNLDSGRGESRDVLQAEQDLTDARLAHLQSMVNYRARTIEKEVLEGRYLENLGMEIENGS